MPIFYIIHMLCCQINLCVSISHIISIMTCCTAWIIGLSCYCFRFLNIRDQRIVLCFLINLPSVTSTRNRNGITACWCKCSFFSLCIILCCKWLNVFFHSTFIECHIHIIVNFNPLRYHRRIDNLCIRFEIIGNRCSKIFVHCITGFCYLFGIWCVSRLFIAACF